MRHRRDKSSFWRQATAALLFCGGLIAWFVRAETRPLNRDELKIEVSDLRSFVAAGTLLVQQAASGKITRVYFETQTDLLQDKAETAMKSLDKSQVAPGLEVKHWRARQMASQTNTALEKLYGSFERSPEMNSVKGDLEKLLPQLKELEESLKG